MTNPNIQVESRPKLRAKSANLEHKLQAKCVTWYGQTFPNRRGQLFAYFAETMNERDGGIKTALGLQPNISDTLYVVGDEWPNLDFGSLWGIEFKHLNTDHLVSHLRSQCEWLLRVPSRGFFCDSLEDFKSIILTSKGGIDPRTVLANISSIRTASVSWNVARGGLTQEPY